MRFSVIVPVYNTESYVGLCVHSILAAAGKRDIELICINDGSTDGSSGVLKSLRLLDERVLIVEQANAGVSAARNRGMELAHGDWILFVDSDDIVRETLFDTIESALNVNPSVDLICFGLGGFPGEKMKWGVSEQLWTDLAINKEIRDVLVEMSCVRFAYQRNLVANLHFPKYNIGEDLMFVAEVLAKAQNGLWTPREEYAYRYREGSSIRKSLCAEMLLPLPQMIVDGLLCIERSGKRIGEGFLAHRLALLFYAQPALILKHLNEPGWRGVLSVWMDALATAERLKSIEPWQHRAIVRVLKSRTSRSVWWNFLFLPRLLRRGLLRGIR